MFLFVAALNTMSRQLKKNEYLQLIDIWFRDAPPIQYKYIPRQNII